MQRGVEKVFGCLGRNRPEESQIVAANTNGDHVSHKKMAKVA